MDRVIYPADLVAYLRRHRETIRRMIADGKLPPFDVRLSAKTAGWRASTLANVGIELGE